MPLPLRRALLAVLFSSLASAQPQAAGPQLRAVLGSPDLSTPVRMLELAFLEGGSQLLALDASGTAQLWDVQRGERRGLVFGPVVVTPSGLRSAPPGRGCLLDGPLVALKDGRLARATRGTLRLCDILGKAPETELALSALTEDGTALAVEAGGTRVAQGTAFGAVVRVEAGAEAVHFQAHEGRVLALRLAAGGELLTAGADGAVRAFDAAGRRLRSVEGMPTQKRAHASGCEGETPVLAAFSDDGSAVVLSTVAGDGLEACPDVPVPARLKLLELPKGNVRWELKGVQASAASFAKDGTLAVAVALRPGEPGEANPSTVVRLEARSGRSLERPNGHQAPITVLRFSPDGRALLSADAAGTFKRWATDTGRETGSAAQGEGAILDLRLTPDGYVLTQHEDDTVRQWSPDGKLLRVLVAPPKGEAASLSPFCRAQEEKTRSALETMGPRPSPLSVRDPGRYAGVTVLPELALSPDGETLLAPVAEESCVSFSPNGCPSGCHRNYHLERVSLRTGKAVQVLPVDEELLGGCVPPAGAFVTRSERAGMNVYGASGSLAGQIGVVLGKVTACEATPDGRKMLVATARSLSVWDAATFSAPVEAVPRRAQAPGPVAFSPRGDVSVDVDGGELRLRRWPRGTFVARLLLGPQDDAPTAMAFAPDAQTLAVGTARGVIYLYALGSSTQTAQQLR